MKELIKKAVSFINKNRFDGLFIFLAIVVLLIGIDRPQIIDGHEKSDKKEETSNKELMNDVKADKIDDAEDKDDEDEYKFIKKRNIFAQDGRYEISKFLKQLPQNPYNLIAVLKGSEKRALFRDYQGNMLFLKEGDKLIDDATLEEIKTTSVKIRREEELLELKVFDVIPKKDAQKKGL
ncbi:MAG TPA: hypothetical protein HPP56_02635 [Nitrospirae bacterium]|nr:hypothetical protein [Nitrospirota bacterium]